MRILNPSPGHTMLAVLRTGAIILLSGLLLLAGCTEKAKDTKEGDRALLKQYINEVYRPPMDVQTYLDELRGIQQSYGHPSVHLGKLPPNRKEPEPLPGRLIVQIASSEIAKTFTPAKPKVDWRGLAGLRLFPARLEIRGVQYVGQARNGDALFQLTLPKRYTRAELAAAFRDTKAERVQIVSQGALRSGHAAGTLAIAAYKPEALGHDFLRFYTPAFYQLAKESSLRYVLKRFGVVGMRRVFKSVEKPAPRTPGTYRVVPFKQLLELARQQNPLRAKRAPETVQSKDLNAILQAYEQHFGQAMPRVTDEAILQVLPALAPYLQIPVRVPDNMENYFVLTFAPGADLARIMQELAAYRNLKKMSFDYPLRAAATNDPNYADQWGLENSGSFDGLPDVTAGFDIKVNQAWIAAPATTPVVVAVADTGFKEDLNELSSRLWTNPYESAANAADPGNPVDPDENGYAGDVHGITTGLYLENSDGVAFGRPSSWNTADAHGTWVAGVIAAQADNSFGITGVAGTDDVRLMNLSLGFFSETGTPCGLAEFAQAVWYAIAPSTDMSKPLTGADVVNASFHGDGVRTYLPQDIIMAARSAGVVIVASAGNEGESFLDMPYSIFPAASPGVITVGGTQRDGHWWSGSNHGYLIDLAAPAAEIATTGFDPVDPASTQAHITLDPPINGTSMSAAFVSGAAAVIIGRFANAIDGPFMDDWLRAKAFDMTDPLGDGADHTGEDEWTGAGMLDLGNAAVAALNALDRPIDVEVAMDPVPQYIKEIDTYVPGVSFAVSGNPLIGVRVQGTSIASWKLSYAPGEFPDESAWIDFYNGSAASDYTQGAYWTIASGGITPLDTDTLANGQLYKLRLQATNGAGTLFNAYRLFRPVRATITVPTKNYVIVPERGWFPLAGYAHLKSGQTFSVSVTDDAGGPLWSSPDYTNPYTDYPVTTGKFLLLNSKESAVTSYHQFCSSGTMTYSANVPTFPADLSFLPEGPIHYVLRAGSETDTVRLYADTSNFPISYWTLANANVTIDSIYDWDYDLGQMPICFHNHDVRIRDKLVITPAGDNLTPRLFVAHIFGVSALDASGTLVWQAYRPEIFYNISSNIFVGNVFGGGTSEVVFAESRRAYYTAPYTPYLSIRNGNTGTVEFEQYLPDLGGIFHVTAGNVSSDAGKELVLSHGTSISVMKADHTFLWTHTFPDSVGAPKLVDLDGDGWDEMLLPRTGQIFTRNETFLSGWSTAGAFYDMDVAWEGSTPRIVLSDGANVYVKALNGATRPGWPVSGSQFIVGKPGTTGNDLVIVYSDRIKTYNLNGSTAAGIPEIVLDGTYGGMELHDVDGDNQNEFVVLVDRYKEDPADDELVGNFLEAYEMTGGARLSDTDNRWPVNIANIVGIDNWPTPGWNRHFAVGNVDGSGGPEVVQFLRIAPYKREYRSGYPGVRIELTHLP